MEVGAAGVGCEERVGMKAMARWVSQSISIWDWGDRRKRVGWIGEGIAIGEQREESEDDGEGDGTESSWRAWRMDGEVESGVPRLKPGHLMNVLCCGGGARGPMSVLSNRSWSSGEALTCLLRDWTTCPGRGRQVVS